MTYMCNKCFEVYHLNATCVCRSCSSSELVEIDELLAPTIQILNKKGYTTTSCCSGHFGEQGARCSIKFSSDIDLSRILPDGYEHGYNNIIQKWFASDNDLALALLCNAICLLDWAREIPVYYVDYNTNTVIEELETDRRAV